MDHSSSLSDAMGQIFDSMEACDFQIMVQSVPDDSPEVAVQTVCAHKMILSLFRPFNVSEGAESVVISISRPCLPHFTTFIR